MGSKERDRVVKLGSRCSARTSEDSPMSSKSASRSRAEVARRRRATASSTATSIRSCCWKTSGRILSQPVVVASADLRVPSAPWVRQDLPDAEDHAAGRAPRCVAAGRRTAGQRSFVHARATARPLRHGLRDHESAHADRAGRPERRSFSAAMAFCGERDPVGEQWTGHESAAAGASMIVPCEDLQTASRADGRDRYADRQQATSQHGC